MNSHLTPEEKWRRIKSPETLDDYHLSITEEELATFPEGRAILDEIEKFRNSCASLSAELLAENFKRSHEEVIAKVFRETMVKL